MYTCWLQLRASTCRGQLRFSLRQERSEREQRSEATNGTRRHQRHTRHQTQPVLHTGPSLAAPTLIHGASPSHDLFPARSNSERSVRGREARSGGPERRPCADKGPFSLPSSMPARIDAIMRRRTRGSLKAKEEGRPVHAWRVGRPAPAYQSSLSESCGHCAGPTSKRCVVSENSSVGFNSHIFDRLQLRCTLEHAPDGMLPRSRPGLGLVSSDYP